MELKSPQLVEFPLRGDERGYLVVMEGSSDVPFEIARVFFVYGSDAEAVRGRHANRNSEFVLVNVAGSSKVRTVELNGVETVFELKDPNVGLYIPKMVWKDMYDFSEDAVLLALASEPYDADEYIRDFEEFRKMAHA